MSEADRLPVARGEVRDHDVRGGADDREVAAEAGAQRERPPQRLGLEPALDQLLDDRDRGRRVRDVVDDRRRERGEPQQADRRDRRVATWSASASASAMPPTIPTWTTASTSMNSPTKKNSVGHSTSRSASCGSSGPTSISTVAPSRAIVAASRPSAEWEQEADDRQRPARSACAHQRPVGDRGRGSGSARTSRRSSSSSMDPPKSEPQDAEERDHDQRRPPARGW